MLKQIKTFNKVHKQDIIFDHDKCKKLHKKLIIKVLIGLLSTNNAGHKDSSANINKPHGNDAKHANSLLHNHITYYFNKIKKIERTLSEHNKHILTSLNKKYSDNRVKLNEFKKVNDKLNLLLEPICLFMFNKNINKESIIENVNVLNNITALIDNKRVCLGEIREYFYENINDIHDNIKNKKYEKVLADLLLIQKHTFKSINRMYIHNVNKKANANNANKKSNKANKKITSANSANEKKASAKSTNKKTTSANEKITSANNANEKITIANNANKKCTDGNNANNNSTCIIKKRAQ